jgi:hypothetical protein
MLSYCNALYCVLFLYLLMNGVSSQTGRLTVMAFRLWGFMEKKDKEFKVLLLPTNLPNPTMHMQCLDTFITLLFYILQEPRIAT